MSKSSGFVRSVVETIIRFFASTYGFVLIVALFVIQAAWIAFTGVFPMAFDEDTHLGIIKFFASHPNPFFGQQPDYLNQYGPVVHDTSYMYRYLMSFPWRLVTHLTSSFTAQVIIMRLINVGLFVLALILFRWLLLKATNNKLIVNISLLLFTLTPITSQLAAQINYDNLMLPLMAASLLVAIKLAADLKRNKIDLWLAGWFIFLSAATLLVKYTYLTMLVPILIYIGWQVVELYRRKQVGTRKIFSQAFKRLGKLQAIGLISLVLFSGGMFFERYGLNVIRYHTPTPSCVQVIGETSCQSFSIYQRSIVYANNKPPVINKNPILFSYRWLKHMNYNLMMALSGPANGYSVGKPLPLPYAISIIFSVGGLALSLIFWRRIFNNSVMRLFVAIAFFYCGALWLTNYASYLSTGRRVAIQGRYLVPLLPIFYLTFLLAFKQLLIRWPKVRVGLATILVLGFAAGGGVFTFILHSDAAWYWPNSTAIQANDNARQVIRYVVPHWGTDYKPYWQSSLSY